MLRQLRVLRELPVLSVHWHEVLRPHQVEDQLQFLFAGVPGDVQRRVHAAIYHVRATLGEVVQHPVDRLLIAGNDAGAEHDRVAAIDCEMFVVPDSHAGERGHRFALAAGNHGQQFRGLHIHDVLLPDQQAVRNSEQAVGMRDLASAHHAPAEERNFTAGLRRQIDNLLHPVNRRAEAGDNHPPLGAVQNIFQPRADRALALGVAAPVRVCRIRKQQQDAALAVIGQRMQVEQDVVGRRRVHFEVACVDDDAERRSNG